MDGWSYVWFLRNDTREKVSSTYMKSFTKVLDSMAQIGAELPHFKAYAQLFERREPVQRVLELFFKDILDFHLTALRFFRLKRTCLISLCLIISKTMT